MATLTPTNPRVVSGIPLEISEDMYIANGQSWKAGQWLYADTSGRLNACASDADSGTGGIKYVALEDADDPGAEDTTKAAVAKITDETVFEINELDGTMGSANEGGQYGIDVTSNVVTLDVGDGGNLAVEVVKLGVNYSPIENDAADVKARCFVKVLTTVLEAARA